MTDLTATAFFRQAEHLQVTAMPPKSGREPEGNFTYDVTGYDHSARLNGYLDGKPVGYIKHSRPGGGQGEDTKAVQVSMMHVEPHTRGKAVGSSMMDALYHHYPNAWINHGDRSEDGAKWWNGYSEPDPSRNVHNVHPDEEHPQRGRWTDHFHRYDVSSDMANSARANEALGLGGNSDRQWDASGEDGWKTHRHLTDLTATSFFRQAAAAPYNHPENEGASHDGEAGSHGQPRGRAGDPAARGHAERPAPDQRERAAGPLRRRASGEVVRHPELQGDLDQLGGGARHVKDTIDTLHRGGSGLTTYPLSHPLEGWHATYTSGGHQVVHRTDPDTKALHVGYAGHNIADAEDRLSSSDGGSKALPVEFHGSAEKDFDKLHHGLQDKALDVIDRLSRRESAPNDHAMKPNTPLKGWRAAHIDFLHRITHRYEDEDGNTVGPDSSSASRLYIGHIGPHNYQDAIKRLTTLTATAFFRQTAGVDHIDLYHRTTPEAAAAIYREKRMHSRENLGGKKPVFFSTFRGDEKDAAGRGYGEGVVHVRVPEHLANIDDEYPSGEEHYWVHAGDLKPEHFVDDGGQHTAARQPYTEDTSDDRPVTFDYHRNTEGAGNHGEQYAQHVEPAGRYISQGQLASHMADDPRYESGQAAFQRPLRMHFGGDYRDPSNWKHQLSQRYQGKTGSDLSQAIRDDGYDGIMTHDEYGPSETVDLTHLQPRTATAFFKQAADVDADSEGEIHRGLGVVLPPDKHAFVHDRAQPLPARAHMLLAELKKQNPEIDNEEQHGGAGGLGEMWSPERDRAELFVNEAASRAQEAHQYKHGGEAPPATRVMMHSVDPGSRHHWTEMFRGQRDEYNDNWRLPLKPGTQLGVTGISWQPHDESASHDDPPPHEGYERYDFSAPVDKTAASIAAQAAAETENGVMVALYPPSDIAAQLAREGGEPVHELHITLAYLGKTSDYTREQLEWLPELVGSWAARQKPVSVRIGGAGKFSNQDSDEHVLWASVDIPGGAQLHSSLAAFLTGHGYRLPSEHGWTPHLTLEYVDKHFRFLPKLDDHHWTSGEIYTCVGGRHVKAVLGLGPR